MKLIQARSTTFARKGSNTVALTLCIINRVFDYFPNLPSFQTRIYNKQNVPFPAWNFVSRKLSKYLKVWNYNQVLKHGNRIHISGQGGWTLNHDNGHVFTYKNLEEEIEEAFTIVEVMLNGVGSSWEDVYSITSYHVNLGNTREEALETMVKFFKKHIGERAPLWTCSGVEAFWDPKIIVEIVVIAFIK